MSTATVIGTAIYKDRTYALLWLGATKFGERAKLAFEDDLDQSFWVDASRLDAHELATPEDATESRRAAPPAPPRRGKRRPPLDGPHPAAQTPPPDDESYCASCGQRLTF